MRSRISTVIVLCALLAMSVQAQQTGHDLQISCDGETITIGNPTDAPTTVRGIFLFRNTPRVGKSNLDLRLRIESKSIQTVPLKELDLAEYQTIHPDLAPDLYACFDPQASVKARGAVGGTGPVAVRTQIEQARALLAKTQTN